MADQDEDSFDPESPFSSMSQGSVSMNELYQSHLSAGFSPAQALYLVACMITNSPGNAPSNLADGLE
jgi:hypothetical protein